MLEEKQAEASRLRDEAASKSEQVNALKLQISSVESEIEQVKT